MSTSHADLPAHPAPQAARMTIAETLFAVFGGPAAWFVQLCSGYALASTPCFASGERFTAPPAALQWTWSAMIVIVPAAVVVALGSLTVSWRAFTRTREERPGGAHDLLEAGAGRTRFLALWGVILGGGFALATAVTAVAFVVLPRCAG